MRHSAIVVGAGLAGSLLSALLAQRGWKVSLLEKRKDPRNQQLVGGRSINLALSTRGIHALSQANLHQQVLDLALPMRGRLVHAIGGDSNFQAYGKNDSEVIYSVSREGLNNILLDACDATGQVDTLFETECTGINGELRTTSYKRQGKTEAVTSDCLFGCDGAGSQVRRALVDAGRVSSTSDMLEHGYKELTIAADEHGAHQLADDVLHIWPRKSFMLIALPNLDGTFTLTLFMPLQGPVSFETFTDSTAGRLLFEEYFPDVLALIPDFDTHYDENPVGTLGTVRCHPWSADGYSLLLGDAAHAVVPFFGQGMNCSFEDCSCLLAAMGPIEPDAPPNWEDIVSRYEATRKPDADAIATMALENYVEMRDSVIDPAYVLKKKLARALEAKYPDRFVPRYSMVTFQRIRYSVAMQRGLIQESILNTLTGTLTEGATDLSGIDWPKAGRLIEQLSPLAIDDGFAS